MDEVVGLSRSLERLLGLKEVVSLCVSRNCRLSSPRVADDSVVSKPEDHPCLEKRGLVGKDALYECSLVPLINKVSR